MFFSFSLSLSFAFSKEVEVAKAGNAQVKEEVAEVAAGQDGVAVVGADVALDATEEFERITCVYEE